MSLAPFANCESLSPQQEAEGVATSEEPSVTRVGLTGSPKAVASQLASDTAFEDEASLWDPEGDGPTDATKGHHVCRRSSCMDSVTGLTFSGQCWQEA